MPVVTSAAPEIEQVILPDSRQAPAEPGDHERLAHYAPKNDVMAAMVDGVAITALCGKTWVPTRDGTKFPVCPECREIWESLDPAQ